MADIIAWCPYITHRHFTSLSFPNIFRFLAILFIYLLQHLQNDLATGLEESCDISRAGKVM
jgi:hypothetical protein